MNVQPDYEELLKLFNKHKVKYAIVGAYSVAFYSLPRYTKDLDILIEATPQNGAKIVRALKDFGFSGLKLMAQDFSKEKEVIQLGYEPVRIDLLTSIEGCTFQEVWDHKKRGTYGRQKVYFIGLNELIKNKKKLNRGQDQIDLEILKKKK
jgi:hypothetical protein